MSIVATDIKLMESERLYDTDDGGGGITGNEVVDGEENNLFPDISELDRTYGDVALRKTFASVNSADTDTYYGCNVIVSLPPSDDDVNVVIFETEDSGAYFNERSTAQNKIESYVAQGVLSNLKMYGNHYAGQRSLFAYQTLGSSPPAAGDVFCLSDGTNTQYVRVQSITYQTVTYTDSVGDFERRECTMTLSSALEYNFTGGEPNRYSTYQPTTKIYKTNAVDAVSYYGIAALAAGVSSGTNQVVVDSYKKPLVPSTQAESSILDIQAGGTRTYSFTSGDRTVTLANVAHTATTNITSSNRGYNYVKTLVPLPAVGTLEISYRAQDRWYTITDDGTGALSGDGSGRVIYTTGSVAVTLKDLPDVDTAIIWAWSSGVHYTARTLSEIGPFRWTGTVEHAPVIPGSVTITWEYPSGTTKTVTDSGGTGVFSGDGTGAINYTSGLFCLTPTLIPEAGATPQIAYEYGVRTTETVSADVDGNGDVVITLANQIAPLSLSVEFVIERALTVSESSSRSTLIDKPSETVAITKYGIGDATWTEYYTTDAYYSKGTYETESVTSTKITSRIKFYDDGVGNLSNGGTVNYADKEIRFNTGIPVTCTYTRTSESGSATSGDTTSGESWQSATSTGWPSDPVSVICKYRIAGGTPTSYTETISDVPLVLWLTPYTSDTTVAGSVEFTLGGKYYVDLDGKIYRGDSCSGAEAPGTYSGTINYETGVVTLTDWTPGSATLALKGLYTCKGDWTEAYILGHTPTSPLRSGEFYVSATAADGTTITGTTDSAGNVTGTNLTGTIDIETGIYSLKFGAKVLASSLTATEKEEDWYDEDNIDGSGYIWRPKEVQPSTVRYNAVVYVYLPLSSDILGLDPVRLPMDGRVPIFRVGDVIVVHYTKTISIENPTVNQVVDTGEVRLAYAKLYDSTGAAVNTDYYSVNLDAGTVTLLTVTGLSTPLSLEARIEDMALVSDLQINGTLTLTKTLSHAYPLGSYVSSALVVGDLFARISKCFSQATWTSVWQDSRIGSTTTGQYNDTIYPLVVTNKGTIEERWALIFESATTFKCVGEYVGQIASGQSVNEDFAPNNPNTNVPYFTVPAAGWGSGWSTGNVLRINTKGANFPVWIARTVLQSEQTSGQDQFRIQIRGDVDTEA